MGISSCNHGIIEVHIIETMDFDTELDADSASKSDFITCPIHMKKVTSASDS